MREVNISIISSATNIFERSKRATIVLLRSLKETY